MKKLEEFINRLNFKVATKIYLIASAVVLILCIATIAYVTRDKICMAIDYERISNAFEKQGLSDNVNSQLKKLNSDSKDIVNILILDKDNNIVFKANSKLIGSNTKLLLTSYEFNRRYLKDNINKDVLYRIVKKENILLNKDYIQNDEKLKNDIDEEFYYERDLNSKDIYLINYIANGTAQNKIFIIRTATPIPYAERLLEITGTLISLIFIIYWIGLALWVYKDANAKRNNPALWGGLVLLTNLAGLIIYFMHKQNSIICYNCGVIQNKENIFCSYCGTKINEQCSYCGNIVNKDENYCSKCGKKL
ncbi:zinc ribbon domain-containing protein [Clostridium sp. WILCCON 0269]|uniref:Zinc ribbon domain-containing protein n=1 Tax=Candidatus Clostridium eludens TaxID=3381663 RepID=A0ABW8SRV4_9CLOT